MQHWTERYLPTSHSSVYVYSRGVLALVDSCDAGTAPNQTKNGPSEASNYALSYLPGQQLSRCTRFTESQPGLMHSDGSFVDRGAPQLDMFESRRANLSIGPVGDTLISPLASADDANHMAKYIGKSNHLVQNREPLCAELLHRR